MMCIYVAIILCSTPQLYFLHLQFIDMLITAHFEIFVIATTSSILRQLEHIKAIKELTNTAGGTPPFTP